MEARGELFQSMYPAFLNLFLLPVVVAQRNYEMTSLNVTGPSLWTDDCHEIVHETEDALTISFHIAWMSWYMMKSHVRLVRRY